MTPCERTNQSRTSESALRSEVTVLFTLLLLLGLTAAPKTAHAVDGCKVLLCLAAPSWTSIPECVPTIRKLMHDLERGRPFPICSISGAGNSATHQWASPPIFCPPQYTHVFQNESGPPYTCDYSGAVAVNIDGVLWTRTWWSTGGDSVTEYTPAAKAKLGTWDTRFDNDYAIWFSSLPPLRCPDC